VTIAGLLFCLFNGCASDSGLNKIPVNNRWSVEDVSNYFRVQEVLISQEISYLIGGKISDFYVLEPGIVLASSQSKTVTKLTMGGELIWQLKPDPSALNRFSDFDLVNYNPSLKLIEIYDPNIFTMYYYGLNGEFIKKEEIAFDFADRESVENNGDVYLYDCSIFNNGHIWGDQQTFNLFTARNDLVLDRYYKAIPLPVDEVSFLDDNSFQRYKNRIFYMKEFSEDTFIFKDGEGFVLDHSIGYDVPVTSYDVIANHDVKDKFKYIAEEAIPYTMQSIQVGGNVFATTYVGGEEFLTLIDNESGDSRMMKYMKIDGGLYPVPYLYSNDYFLSTYPSYVAEYLDGDDSGHAKKISEDVNSMVENKGDKSSLRFVLFSPKEY